MIDRHELDEVFVAELARRIDRLRTVVDPRAIAAELVALRGAAGLAGHSDFALMLGELARRVRAGDGTALGVSLAVTESALRRLGAGEPPLATRWPEPPPLLGPAAIDERFRAEYLDSMRTRASDLARLARLPRDEADAAEVVAAARRVVHAMKGASSAVGDEVTAWYCHGLEAELPRLEEASLPELCDELERQRALISALVEDPTAGLAVLRGKRPEPTHDEAPLISEGAVLATARLERFAERLDRLELVHEELVRIARAERTRTLLLREQRAALAEALRLIGPPRPWGAPAAALGRVERAASALAGAADSAALDAEACRRGADALAARVDEMQADLGQLRRTSVSFLFDRVAPAAEKAMRDRGLDVHIERRGVGLPIDRRVAERLVDPLLSLVRNAVAHGLEPPADRALVGKPAVGTISLAAEALGDWLRIVVEDDGAGVDLPRLRQLAVEREILTRAEAESAHSDSLLSVLFAPGLTTRRAADHVSGRGLGLDLAEDAVRRLGGSLRLGARPGGGLRATIEVPGERTHVDVVWVLVERHEVGIPVTFTGRVVTNLDRRGVAQLGRCLGLKSESVPSCALELRVFGVQPVFVALDAVGHVETVTIRSIPSVVRREGPYGGAVLRGDGSLRLVIDAAVVAARAWAYVA